jgi:hypothetical protein
LKRQPINAARKLPNAFTFSTTLLFAPHCAPIHLWPCLISAVRLRTAAEKLGAFNDDSEQQFSELGPKFAAKGKQLHGIKNELDVIFERIRCACKSDSPAATVALSIKINAPQIV